MSKIETGTIYLEDLFPGLTRTITKTIGEKEIQLFAEVSEDFNPVHMCEEYAATTMFEGRIAHGMLSAALFSAIIGEQLPGHGTIYLGQNLKFTAPVRIGDTVTAEVSVAEVDEKRARARLDCVARVGETTVIKGDALVIAPRRP